MILTSIKIIVNQNFKSTIELYKYNNQEYPWRCGLINNTGS